MTQIQCPVVKGDSSYRHRRRQLWTRLLNVCCKKEHRNRTDKATVRDVTSKARFLLLWLLVLFPSWEAPSSKCRPTECCKDGESIHTSDTAAVALITLLST